jgi:hypothetical protein
MAQPEFAQTVVGVAASLALKSVTLHLATARARLKFNDYKHQGSLEWKADRETGAAVKGLFKLSMLTNQPSYSVAALEQCAKNATENEPLFLCLALACALAGPVAPWAGTCVKVFGAARFLHAAVNAQRLPAATRARRLLPHRRGRDNRHGPRRAAVEEVSRAQRHCSNRVRQTQRHSAICHACAVARLVTPGTTGRLQTLSADVVLLTACSLAAPLSVLRSLFAHCRASAAPAQHFPFLFAAPHLAALAARLASSGAACCCVRLRRACSCLPAARRLRAAPRCACLALRVAPPSSCAPRSRVGGCTRTRRDARTCFCLS